MTPPTLDNMTPAQLRDLATRATNAAVEQEKAEAEKKRLADEAKQKAEIVFERGDYALLKDGTLQFQGRIASCFNHVTIKDLLGRIQTAGGGYDKLTSFLAAYEVSASGKSKQDEAIKAHADAYNRRHNDWANTLYGYQGYGYSRQNLYGYGSVR